MPVEVISSSVDEENDMPKSILKKTAPACSESDSNLDRNRIRQGSNGSIVSARGGEYKLGKGRNDSVPTHKSESARSDSGGSKLMMSSFSSGGGESLKEVWEMLEQGDGISSGVGSPDATLRSTVDSAHGWPDRHGKSTSLGIQGKSASLGPRPRSPAARRKMEPLSPPTRQRSKSGKQGKFNVRNWNVK